MLMAVFTGDTNNVGGTSWKENKAHSPGITQRYYRFFGVLERGGCTQFVHSRSRMTIDPRIPTLPGRSTSGFHQPGRHCLHQARSAVRYSASRMKGELHPSKNRS